MNKLNHTGLAPIAAALMGLSLSACAATTGAKDLQLVDPVVAANSHIGVIRMSSGWVNANEEFGGTFTDSLHENLGECAKGPQRLDLNVHVDKVRRADRLATLWRGHGTHQIAAVAELVEPKTKRVVGRYPIHLKVDAGNPLEVVLADRQLMVSDAFATELCRQAFGA